MNIGLVIPLAQDEHGRALTWDEIAARARQAESSGYDSVWLYDHLFHRFDGHRTVGFHECWTVLSALAAVTERVELGTTVLCAGFRNPALLAKMATTLDTITNGRLILGVGAGWHEPEFDGFGLPFDHRVSRFEEALQIIRPLLREGSVSFAGRYHHADSCEILPRGPRAAGPPILVGAFGPRMMRLTARYADQWTIDWLGPPVRVREQLGRVHDACRAEGRDPATLTITGGVTVAYPDLGELPGWMSAPESYLTGDAHALGRQLAAYGHLGVDHLITNLYPLTEAAVARYGEAIMAAHACQRVTDSRRQS
ncbi:LLM class F420-dependent oxidoreductase [soil metagenome]